MTKYIFVTGGVLSGVGKGVSAASIGALLKARGNTIFVQKLDPYLNQDPGTMSPYQHGEVYVTKDGGETDLDLGHYERFIGSSFGRDSNYTTGSIYNDIFKAEREGKYEGKTVQVIPHVTTEIKNKIHNAAMKHKPDFMIVEIGGTVGDIESQPYIYAAANFSSQEAIFIHTTYVPYLNASHEHKTKPTQHSVQLLKSYGISPNIIILRSNTSVSQHICDKVAIASYLDPAATINLPNTKNIYSIPSILKEAKIINLIEKHFDMPHKVINMQNWRKLNVLINSKKTQSTKIAMVGKYTELHDAYLSIIESLNIASIYAKTNLTLKWVDSSKITDKNISKKIENCDGVIVLPGFGIRGFSGKIATIKYTRIRKIPTLGICYGMQAMVINQAHIKGIENPTSSEFNESGTFVVDIIRGTKLTKIIGGTLRLGEWESMLKKDSLARSIYKKDLILTRHRHRYEINPEYKDIIEDEDFIFSGINPKTNLAEIAELKSHPFYIGVQYHPEFSTTTLKSNPLFDSFIKAAIDNK